MLTGGAAFGALHLGKHRRTQDSDGQDRQIMNITKPIIIVGTGRCGSTVFHRLLRCATSS